MVTRWAVLFVVLIASGCSSTYGDGLSPFSYSGKQQIYLFGHSGRKEMFAAYPYRRGWCFIRYKRGLALDEICESGEYLRYSTDVRQSHRDQPQEISSHVLGLFEYMAKNKKVN